MEMSRMERSRFCMGDLSDSGAKFQTEWEKRGRGRLRRVDYRGNRVDTNHGTATMLSTNRKMRQY